MSFCLYFQITQIDLKGFFEMLCGEVHRLRLGDYHHQTRIAFVEFAMVILLVKVFPFWTLVLVIE
jgi:hypothetical protein